MLLEPADLDRVLQEPDPPVVLDARWFLDGTDGAAEFAAGHIPGSRHIDLETELSDRRRGRGRHPLPAVGDFSASMRRHGVRADRAVVTTDGGDTLGAARLWWLLSRAGHPRVFVLAGGFGAWREAGGAVATGAASQVAVGNFVAGVAEWPDVVTAEELPGVLAGGGRVWDARSPERYRGELEPIDPVAGHVPGALNLPATGLREGPRLREQVAPGDVVYCGSGVTAARAILVLELAGRRGVRLYAGSWSDWITDPDRPVATGSAPTELAR